MMAAAIQRLDRTRMLTSRLSLLLLILVAATSQQDIRLPPTILRSPPPEITFRTEEVISLECVGTGTGSLNYEWTKNDADLNLNDHAHLKVENIDGGGSRVTIMSASTFDEGYYQCVVSNGHGKSFSNTTKLQRATLGEPAMKTTASEEALEGQPFTIRAQGHKSFPRPTYSWEMAQGIEDTAPVKVQLGPRIQMSENGDLHFAYTKLSDSSPGRIYKLVTFNQYLDQKQGGSYTNLTIKPVIEGTLKNFRPTVSFPSTTPDLVGVIGRNISLRCFFAAYPEATHKWSGPKGQLDVKRTDYALVNTELIIRDIKQEDEGVYRCTGVNIEGEQSQDLPLRVQAAPAFPSPSDRLSNKNVTVGQTATFTCNAPANPTSSVKWYWNGVPLVANNLPPRMRFTNNNRNLVIDRVCKDCKDNSRLTDLMVIQCNVSNIHGYVLGTGYLNVLEETKVESVSDKNFVEVKLNEPRSVTFQCIVAKSDPSTPVTIQWYKVINDQKTGDSYEDLVYSRDNRVELGSDGQLTFTLLSNDTYDWMEYRGVYKCVADSGYSRDFKTVTLSVENVVPPDIFVDNKKSADIFEMWWIFLIAAAVLLLLILLLCCCICIQRNKGDIYLVDEKERKNHNDLEKDIEDDAFQEYKRPDRPLKGSRGSLTSSTKLNSDDDASLNDYGDVDPGKFTEDGSFVGVYTSNTGERKH